MMDEYETLIITLMIMLTSFSLTTYILIWVIHSKIVDIKKEILAILMHDESEKRSMISVISANTGVAQESKPASSNTDTTFYDNYDDISIDSSDEAITYRTVITPKQVDDIEKGDIVKIDEISKINDIASMLPLYRGGWT